MKLASTDRRRAGPTLQLCAVTQIRARAWSHLTVVASTLVVIAACSVGDDKASAAMADSGSVATEPQASRGHAAATTPTSTSDSRVGLALGSITTAYAGCHQLLADDMSDGVDVCAREIATSVRAAESSFPIDARVHLDALATAATVLSKTPRKMNALRIAFGEVSRCLIVLLDLLPEEAERYRVFKCPMTMSYKRWVQTDAKLVNPYMGTSMRDCGYEVE